MPIEPNDGPEPVPSNANLALERPPSAVNGTHSRSFKSAVHEKGQKLSKAVKTLMEVAGPKEVPGSWRSSAAVLVKQAKGYADEDKACVKITRAWEDYKYQEWLDRDAFATRLELENAVGIGVIRLALYSLIFIFIVLCLNVGVPDSEKLGVHTLISEELDLSSFLEVSTLEQLRDQLPIISSRFKRFSPSSHTRFDREDGFVMLQDGAEMVRPLRLFTFDPEVTHSFSLTAWVQVLSAGAKSRLSLLRKPMASDRLRSCWGWFLSVEAGRESPQLRFGAHDFYSLDDNPEALEEVVSPSGSHPLPAAVSHEVLVVDGLTATFYRNGQRLGARAQLPREMTDCVNPDFVELGDGHMAISAVKFYPRPLTPAEVDETFQGGAPLVEVATSSRLSELQEDGLLQVGAEVKDGTVEVLTSIADTADTQMVSSKVGLSAAINNQPDDNPTFPFDPSPAAVLGQGAAVAGMLPERERAAWEAAGGPSAAPLTNFWASDEVGEHWSLLELPMHGDGTGAGRLPELAGAEGLTVSMWFKSHVVSQGYGPHLEFVREAQGGLPAVAVNLRVQLDWVTIEVVVDGVRSSTWRFLTVFDHDSGSINEGFLLTAFAGNPLPLVWRHLLYRYHAATGAVSFFLDGKLVVDTLEPDPDPSYSAWTHPKASVHELFSNASVTPHAWTRGGAYRNVPGKVAQLRVYPRMLTEDEITRVHNGAVWGSGESVRQCTVPSEDLGYHDTVGVDAKGHSCAWFAQAAQHSPYICRQPWAKLQCPVTCGGTRICHDGSLSKQFQKPPTRRKFQVFDRITHIRPSPRGPSGSESSICPAAHLWKEEVLRECEAMAAHDAEVLARTGTRWFDGPGRNNFTRFLERSNKEVHAADVRDCAVLAERWNDDCRWDSSWLDDFESDYNETGTWAMSFWAKPTSKSLGMPTNFWFLIQLFSSLAPPLTLMHWNEIKPKLEPWMDAYSLTWSDDGETIETPRGGIWPTTLIPYASGWTFFHMQLERLPSGNYRLCATLNAIPLFCDDRGPGGPVFSAGQFLSGIEFSTEMLVTPIEVSTQSLSPSEVQRKYYWREPGIAKSLGPSTPTAAPGAKQTLSFDNKLLLMAPPILFQTRRTGEGCESAVVSPTLDAQLSLLTAAHCVAEGCTGADRHTLVTCAGGPDSSKHYGRGLLELGGRDGVADFLYTVADNPVLVRDGLPLRSRGFLDTLTDSAAILAVFQNPASGLTTELAINCQLGGLTVKSKASFFHLGFVSSEQHPQLSAMYAALLCLVAMTIGFNFWFVYDLHLHSRRTEEAIKAQDLWEVAYDIAMGLLVLGFAVTAFVFSFRSERKALDFAESLAAIPFASPDVEFGPKVRSFFGSLDLLDATLAEAERVFNACFAILVLTLIRIVYATGAHPRLRVLIGSMYHAVNDLYHFALLMVVVFVFFAFTANWMFGASRTEFRDLQASLLAMFEVLMGRLPKGFEEDVHMTVMMVLCVITLFFFLRHFLLAIIMQGYLKLRREVEDNKCAQGFGTDVLLTLRSFIKEKVEGWPSRKRLAYILRHKLAAARINQRFVRIHLPDVSRKQLQSIFDHYHAMPALRCPPPPWTLPPTKYPNLSHQAHVKHALARICDKLALPPDSAQPHAAKAHGEGSNGGRGNGVPAEVPMPLSPVAEETRRLSPKLADGILRGDGADVDGTIGFAAESTLAQGLEGLEGWVPQRASSSESRQGRSYPQSRESSFRDKKMKQQREMKETHRRQDEHAIAIGAANM